MERYQRHQNNERRNIASLDKNIDQQTSAQELDNDAKAFLSEDSNANMVTLFRGDKMAEKIGELDDGDGDAVELFVQRHKRYIAPEYATDPEKSLAFLKSVKRIIETDPTFNQ